MAKTINYEVRYEDFGDGLETWAIYQITKNEETNTSISTHVRDAKTEEAALDIVDSMTGDRSSELDIRSIVEARGQPVPSAEARS